MRKKIISFLGAVCVLCLHAIPSTAEQLTDVTYDLVEKRYENNLPLFTDLLDVLSIKLTADLALVNARIGLRYNYYQLNTSLIRCENVGKS